MSKKKPTAWAMHETFGLLCRLRRFFCSEKNQALMSGEKTGIKEERQCSHYKRNYLPTVIREEES